MDKRVKEYLKGIQKIEKQIDQLNTKYGVNDVNVTRTNQSGPHNVTGVRSDDSVRQDDSKFHIRGLGNSNNTSETRNSETQRSSGEYHIRGLGNASNTSEARNSEVQRSSGEYHIRGLGNSNNTSETRNSETQRSSNREYHIRGIGNSSDNSETRNSEVQRSSNREYHIKGIKSYKNDSRSKVVKLVSSVNEMEESGVEFYLPDSISLDQSYVLNDDAVTQISSQDLVVTDYTLTSYCYQKRIKKENENIMRRKLSKGNVSLALLASIIFFIFSIILFLIR